jgi:phosphate starvation-inducible PhoH-like protein
VNSIAKHTDTPVTLDFHDNRLLPLLYGEHNAHLDYIEDALGVDIISRGNSLTIHGQRRNTQTAGIVLDMLWQKLEKKQDVTINEVDAALRFARGEKTHLTRDDGRMKPEHYSRDKFFDEKAAVKTGGGKMINPRTPNQAAYIDMMRGKDMVFGIGPAGTGKTFLAVATAVSMYQEGLVKRMVFTRPAVEAGERLGFLPGDLLEKIDPYLRPIYDALHEMMPADMVQKKIAAGDIEIAPLAFMRGRTLKDAFVVLDEAQNTTSMQMKMFLTRMGEGTRMVINGDPSQIDLPPGAPSGLKEAITILGNIEDIGFMQFSASDVVRHKLVSRIIESYDAHDFRPR